VAHCVLCAGGKTDPAQKHPEQSGLVSLLQSVAAIPDRVYMREAIIPYILKRGALRVLSVGVGPHTVEITDLLTAGGAEVWTLDIDPQLQRWGSPERHIVGNAIRIDEIEGTRGFSCVLFNGVLGFGIDHPDDIGRTFVGLSEILPPGGLVVLGWNTDQTQDPLQHPEFRRFRYIDDKTLPARVTFPGSTHVYDFIEPAATA
jgi:hypothetical protein